jgi:hypothetical protein
MASALGTMMGNAPSGGWESYCIVGKHKKNANLFSNNFIKIEKFI